MEGASASTVVSEDDDFVVSYEDSSCTVETEIELGLALCLGLRAPRNSRPEDCCSSASSSCSSSSLSRASGAAGIKRTADSMAATNGQVVGWPPIRSYRMNSMVNQAKTVLATGELNPDTRKNGNKNRTIFRSDAKKRHSMFVKVTMDGIPIGRKIDLNAHRSYESLSKTLEEMFLKPPSGSSTGENNSHAETRLRKLLDGSSGFVLTYEDKEGDWMLVGDVPWGMFIGSVRRLRIMRTAEATGTAQRIT